MYLQEYQLDKHTGGGEWCKGVGEGWCLLRSGEVSGEMKLADISVMCHTRVGKLG